MSDTAAILRRLDAIERRLRNVETIERPAPLLIAATTLGAGAASVTLTPSGAYANLRIVWTARGEAAASLVALYLRFNGDTGANYDFDYNQTANSASSPGTSTGQTFIRCGVLAAASAAAGLCGSGQIVIPHYQATSFEKHVVSQSHARHSGAAADVVYEDGGGNWRSASAITAITLLASTGNLAANSAFALYGEM